MARRGGSAIQDELYSTPDETAREEVDDARLLDLDAEKESPFLRAQKRVSVRRGPLPKKTATRLLWVVLAIAVLGISSLAVAAAYHLAEHSWRFRLDSSDNIELAGLHNVTRSQIMEVMGGDIGRNVFFIPLEQRQKQLEQIPWVESASVMRFEPNRIRIQIHERTPVAFARIGSKVMLVDAAGILMDLAGRKKFSFPVIVGISPGEPLSTRTAQMKIYNQLIGELDSGGGRYSQDLSEVDLSDPEDVKVLTNDPDGEVLVHLGSENYLDRFKIYVSHLRDWRQQFSKLESVDLRYDQQIIVNPDLHGPAHQPALTASVAKAAIAAGVKPSALLNREPARISPHVVPVALSGRKQNAPAQARRPVSLIAARSNRQLARRRPAPAKHSGKPAAHNTSAALIKPKIAHNLQKPSPAILKGQENQ
jgi:cell division protein FtsQ